MDAAMINAIAGLWPLLAVMLLLFVIFYWRKEWPDLLRSLYIRGKWGQAEAEIRRNVPAAEEKNPTTKGQVALPSPSTDDDETAVPTVRKETLSVGNDRYAMLDAFLKRNENAAEEIYKRIQDAETDPVKRLKNQALYLYMRFLYLADTTALAELDKLSENPDVKHQAHYWKGMLYEETDAFDKANNNFETAANAASSDEERTNAVIGAARAIYQVDHSKGFSRIIQQISTTTDPDSLKAYFSALGKLYERSQNHGLRAVAFEKVLEFTPNDTDALFSAAYSYGEREFDPISLLHYKKLLEFSPQDAMAQNNAGVVYKNLDMPIGAIKHYRKSAELGETLAMANLAFLYMHAGLEEEALKVLDNAKTKENVHPSVGRAMARLTEKKIEEQKTENQVIEDARKEQRFLSAFGDAYFRIDQDCPNFTGKWESGEGIELDIIRTDNILAGTWKVKERLLAKEKGFSFSGEANNRGAVIEVREGGSILGNLFGKGYAYMSVNGQECFTLTIKDAKHSLQQFKRIS